MNRKIRMVLNGMSTVLCLAILVVLFALPRGTREAQLLGLVLILTVVNVISIVLTLKASKKQ